MAEERKKERKTQSQFTRRNRSRGLPHEEEKPGDQRRVLIEEPNRSHFRFPVTKATATTSVRTETRTTRPSQNGGNGPHPAESLPSAGEEAAAARQGRRGASFLNAGEHRTGRSCLPQMRLPPSATAPIALTDSKEALWASRGSLRRWGREDKVVARDSTRDSMENGRETKRGSKQKTKM